MQQDPVLATLQKLKRQNEQITVQKEKISDLKSIKRIRKTNEFNEALEKYKEIDAQLQELQKIQQILLDRLRRNAEE